MMPHQFLVYAKEAFSASAHCLGTLASPHGKEPELAIGG